MSSLRLHYPRVSRSRRRELAVARKELLRRERQAPRPAEPASVSPRGARAPASRRDASAERSRTAGSRRCGIRRLQEIQVAGERAGAAGEVRDARRPQLLRERLRNVAVEPGAWRVDICEPLAAAFLPPCRGSAAAAACRRRAEPRRAARSGRHRAPPLPRARPRASGHPCRSRCAASRRARNRDRARSRPRRRADARRRPRAPRDAARAAAAGRPSGRARARAHRAIPRRPRRDASRSARRAAVRQHGCRCSHRPSIPVDSISSSDRVERGRRNLVRLDDQCRLPSRDLQIGKRQHVRRRQALREMVNQRADPCVVHRAVVDRDQLVAAHQAETPAGRQRRAPRSGLRAAGNRGAPHPARRGAVQAIGPRAEHPREIPLLLRVARGHVEAAVAAAVATWLTTRRQHLVYAHAPMLLSARFRAQRAVR